MRHPLPLNRLPNSRVDAQTAVSWIQTAHDRIRSVLENRDSWYYTNDEGASATPDAVAKKLVFDKKGVRGYSLSPESARKKTFFAHGVLRLALEDIAYALYCDDTTQQRLYSCKTRDADGRVVLVQYVSTHPHASSSSVFGSSHAPSSASPSSSSASQTSQSLAHTFASQRAGLARGSHVQISTFRFMDEGTQYKSMGSLVVGKQLPAWASMKTVLQAFSSVLGLGGLADARAVSSLGLASAAATTKTCHSCKKKFGLLRARLNCRACGQCVCKNCTLKLKFFNEKGLSVSGGPHLISGTFCLGCVRQSRDKRPESGSFCEVFDSVSSEESNMTVRASADEVLLDLPEDDFWDLHDEDGGIDEYPFVPSKYFDRFGGLRPATKITTNRVPGDTMQVIDFKTSSRGTAQASAPQRHRSKSQQAVPVPKLSPVEVFLARTKAERQRAAEEAAASQAPGAYLPNAREASPPTGPNFTSDDMFNKLSKSLAEQEKLLQSIQEEAHKMRVRAASGEASSRRQPTVSSIPENGEKAPSGSAGLSRSCVDWSRSWNQSPPMEVELSMIDNDVEVRTVMNCTICC
ncbi:hypothetical protein PybrP1_007705 [[Pythium] brassicae (nom. inval.)]|nr:hypothetical protein PybrP1_007705 [[Pythium] brassicae (nom. inval.)]